MRHEILELDPDDDDDRPQTRAFGQDDLLDIMRDGIRESFAQAMDDLPRTIQRELSRRRGRILDRD